MPAPKASSSAGGEGSSDGDCSGGASGVSVSTTIASIITASADNSIGAGVCSAAGSSGFSSGNDTRGGGLNAARFTGGCNCIHTPSSAQPQRCETAWPAVRATRPQRGHFQILRTSRSILTPGPFTASSNHKTQLTPGERGGVNPIPFNSPPEFISGVYRACALRPKSRSA
jgi:hypothetical protein